MGRLTFPVGSLVYLDTAPIIYAVEKHINFWPLLEPFWIDVGSGAINIVTSELTLLEVLVAPIRLDNEPLIDAYQEIFSSKGIEPIPIDTGILRHAARLRATQNFKTPDAIHAATAMLSNCHHFVSNDEGFRRLSAIDVTILSDLT